MALTMYQPVYLWARERKRGVQAGDEETTGDSGGSVRLAGQAGLGKMQVEGAVESRL